jgi:Rv2175c C-terminal domain of unknown function
MGVDEIATVALPDVAAQLGVSLGRVRQYLRDGQLVAMPDSAGVPRVPATLLCATGIVKGLPGVITLLRDARYSDSEIITWLHRSDESLPGTPIDALRQNRGREVKRRAQVAGY